MSLGASAGGLVGQSGLEAASGIGAGGSVLVVGGDAQDTLCSPRQHLIGALPDRWNHLVDVQPAPLDTATDGGPTLLHWTLGGPWFREQRTMGGPLAAEWFSARDDALRLWD